MTREEYIQHRTKMDFLPVAYEYYSKNGGTMDKGQFFANFIQMAGNNFMYRSNRGQIKSILVELVWKYFDNKFEMQEVYDKGGKLIKIL